MLLFLFFHSFFIGTGSGTALHGVFFFFGMDTSTYLLETLFWTAGYGNLRAGKEATLMASHSLGLCVCVCLSCVVAV
jgi:hypothetical protein